MVEIDVNMFNFRFFNYPGQPPTSAPLPHVGYPPYNSPSSAITGVPATYPHSRLNMNSIHSQQQIVPPYLRFHEMPGVPTLENEPCPIAQLENIGKNLDVS